MNRTHQGRLPLIIAANLGNSKCLQVLLSVGANVNKTDGTGQTALMCAAENGFHKLAQLLMSKRPSKYIQECLLLATASGNKKCVELFIKAGVEVNQFGTSFHFSEYWRFSHYDKSPVAIAAINNNRKCLDLLLSSGADVNHTDNEGRSSLIHTAISDTCMSLHLLLEAGADVNIYDKAGFTPLLAMMAWRGLPGMLTCVKELLAAGANVNRLTNRGESAADLLWKRGFNSNALMKVARLLYIAGEKIDRPALKLQDDSDVMSLFDRSRDVIRARLLEENQHENLFCAVHRLGLASPASRLLVFNVSLSDNEEEREEDDKK